MRGFPGNWERKRAALIIAHPGHELRVYHWLERARPLVFVLTDGSGHTASSRLDSTTALVRRVGALPGPVYGRLSDQQLYAAILSQDFPLFACLAEEIAASLESEGVDYVAGDAVEGFNPGHDVCRLLMNAALMRLETMSNTRIPNLEFPLEGPPVECSSEDLAEALIIDLDDEAFQRKLAAVRGYAELAGEVDRILARIGPDPFRVECLRPVRYSMDIKHRFQHPAFYERYGENQVAAGYYQSVIRFGVHIEPLAKQLTPFTSPADPAA